MIMTEILGVQFEIYPHSPHVTFKKIKERFKDPFKYINKSQIEYIEIGDFDEVYIYMKKDGEPKNEWNETTFQFAKLLNLFGFDACLADEDYGYVDVIVINEWL